MVTSVLRVASNDTELCRIHHVAFKKKQLNNGSRWKLFNPALTLAYKKMWLRYRRDLWWRMFRIRFSISKVAFLKFNIWLDTNIQRKTGQLLRSSLFRDVMPQWWVVTDVSAQSIGPIFKSQSTWTVWPLMMHPTGCVETSVITRLLDPVREDRHTVPKYRQITTKLRCVTSQKSGDGSLKSRSVVRVFGFTYLPVTHAI